MVTGNLKKGLTSWSLVKEITGLSSHAAANTEHLSTNIG